MSKEQVLSCVIYALATIATLLACWLYNQTKALTNQTERADLLYCQVIRQSLDNQTVEPTRNRIMLENTYFQNDCNTVIENE